MDLAGKRALVRTLQDELARDLDVARRAAIATKEGATHEENRPENDKDTRAIEASYLAGAQAERVRELERVDNALAFLDVRSFGAGEPIAQGAVVELDRDGERSFILVAPLGGGMKATVEGRSFQVVTPASPLGAALLGKTEGDSFEVRVSGGLREYEIVRVT